MAQHADPGARHESIIGWVNPEAWDDRESAQRVIDAITKSGSDDEADWVRKVAREEGPSVDLRVEVLEAASRDYDTAIEQAEGVYKVRMIQAVTEAAASGMSEYKIAKAVGVTRMTVRAWLGK